MATARHLAEARRHALRVHRNLAEDVRRLREDAGATRAQLASTAGIDLAYLCVGSKKVANGPRSTPTPSSRSPSAPTSPRGCTRTRGQPFETATRRILEALLSVLHPRWQAYPEVAVRRPSRGWIDVVLHSAREGRLVATEIQSDLPRLEQLLRWFGEKVSALPSWEGWPSVGDVTDTSRLLVVRSTRATRAVGREFERQLVSAYPAHPADAIASLRGTSPLPGAALIWADVEPQGVRFVGRR